MRNGFYNVEGMTCEELYHGLEEREIIRYAMPSGIFPYSESAFDLNLCSNINTLMNSEDAPEKLNAQVVADGIVVLQSAKAMRVVARNLSRFHGMISALTNPMHYLADWDNQSDKEDKWCELVGRLQKRLVRAQAPTDPAYSLDLEEMIEAYSFARVLHQRSAAIRSSHKQHIVADPTPSGWQMIVIFDETIGSPTENVLQWAWIGHRRRDGKVFTPNDYFTMSAECCKEYVKDTFEQYVIMNGGLAKHNNVWSSHT